MWHHNGLVGHTSLLEDPIDGTQNGACDLVLLLHPIELVVATGYGSVAPLLAVNVCPQQSQRGMADGLFYMLLCLHKP